MSTNRFSLGLVDVLHDLGAVVLVHTVNDREDIVTFTKAGADGFYTDFPSLLMESHTSGTGPPRSNQDEGQGGPAPPVQLNGGAGEVGS